MSERDIGTIPVRENDRLVGRVTDSRYCHSWHPEGKGPDTKVQQVMTRQIEYCFDDDDVDPVCANMADLQLRRLPVLNHNKRLVGIVALGDIATKHIPDQAGLALEGISQSAG